jgi:hypothetical protein
MTSPTAIDPSDAVASTGRNIRLAGVVLLAWLAWTAFHSEYGRLPLLGDVDVAIHECGHILFMPFGRTMMILGGSLWQVVFPLIFAAYFLRWRRDTFGGMVCFWWSALNLLDVSIYCADSRAGQLMLLDGSTGQESDSHDWNNLLTTWHALAHDTLIAHRMRAIAVLVCVASLCIAAWSAWQPRALSDER